MTSMWKRIIIFRQGLFGDTLVTFHLIEALHQLYPRTRLVYCTQNFKSGPNLQGHEVLSLNPFIEEVVTYDFEDPIRKKYLKLKKNLKAQKDDLLLYLPYSATQRYRIIRDWLFFKALNFKNMLCFQEMWKWTYLYEMKEGELPKESERILDFVRRAGIPLEFSRYVCSVNCDEAWAEDKLREWGLNGKEVLAISPFSRIPGKRWPLGRYIEVGRAWYRRTGMSLVIIGGPLDVDEAAGLLSHWQGYGYSACGVSLRQTAGILRRAKAFCGNDSGCMHLAAILGIPCVAIFSSRERPRLWHPYGERHIVLREDVDCQFCGLKSCDKTPPLCLERISVERVLNGLSRIYKNGEGYETKVEGATSTWRGRTL